MPTVEDAASSGGAIVDLYDRQLDELMNAINKYVSRTDTNTGGYTSIIVPAGSTLLPAGGTLTRDPDDPGIFRGPGDSIYAQGKNGGLTRIDVTVNGRELDASKIESPGIQLVIATATNDIATNIGLVGKTVADKNNLVKILSQKL
jgi:hypothetical protein